MIPRRVKVNLVAFALLFLALSAWAVRNVVRLDVLERPQALAAEFVAAPGLRPNVEVTYLGVRVGSIRSVELEEEVVRVDMALDRGTRLPEGVTAAISRKSAVGEPYISLLPPDGYDGGGPYVALGGDAVIPVERTSVPLSYGDLFGSLGALVDAVPAEELGSVLDELATALEGRGPALRQLLESGEDLTTTLAERSELFDELAGELTRLTSVVATERDAVGSAFDDLAALTDTLARSADDLDRLLTEAPVFGRQVEALLQASLADLGCTFEGIGGLFEAIGDEEQIAQLLRVLDVARAASDAFNTAVIEAGDFGADGPYLAGSFGIVADDPPPQYDPRPELPPAPPLPQCAELAASLGPGAGSSGTAEDRRTDDHEEAAHDLDVSRRTPAPERDLPASTDRDLADQRFPLALAIGAAGILLLLAVGLVGRRPTTVGAGSSHDAGEGRQVPTHEDDQ